MVIHGFVIEKLILVHDTYYRMMGEVNKRYYAHLKIHNIFVLWVMEGRLFQISSKFQWKNIYGYIDSCVAYPFTNIPR
jgi:hypothetical protein